jgi:hypothetical protein
VKRYIDSTFPDSLKLAKQYEDILYETIDTWASKDYKDRVTLIQAFKYIDQKISLLGCASFVESEKLSKAYPYLETCNDATFWGPGYDRFRSARQSIWEQVLNGTQN